MPFLRVIQCVGTMCHYPDRVWGGHPHKEPYVGIWGTLSTVQHPVPTEAAQNITNESVVDDWTG